MRQPSQQDALYTWYYAALQYGAGSPQAPIHADEPKCGYFRLKGKNGNASLPCYIAMEAPLDEFGDLAGDEVLICKVRAGATELDRDPYSGWTYLAGHPVPYEAFKQAWETGRWPDDAPGANFQAADSLEGLTDQLEAMMASAEAFRRIESQEQCDQAANLKTRIGTVKKAIDDMRKAEKEPHDKAAQAIQAKFLPWLAKCTNTIDELGMAILPWLKKAEYAAKAAAVAAAGAAVEVKARAGGLEGKRTSIRARKVPVIVHYKAAALAVLEEPEVKKGVEAAVKRWFKEGKTAPGVEIKEEEKVI